MKKKLRVAVVMGGRSSEHEISLKSGEEVIKNLDKNKYQAIPIIIGKTGSIDAFKKIKHKIDICFIAMHGEHTEDGSIEGFCELQGISYTGPRLLTAALTMDKIFSRKLFRLAQLNVPNDLVVRKGQKNNILKHLKLPVVIKPHNQGSSIGVTIVHSQNKINGALKLAWSYSDLAIVEEYLKGTEIACAILGNEKPIVLPLVEIVPKKEFFDYEAKYSEKLTDEICPARISSLLTKKTKEAALKAYKTLGCSVFSRVDLIIINDRPYILEINPIPGLTPVSLFPKAAKAAGITYPELLTKIIELSLKA